MPKSLLDSFSSLDRVTRERLADTNSPLVLALGALFVAREQCGIEELTAEHIVAALEAAGVAVSKISITRSLARAGGKVSRSEAVNGETLFKIMVRGERIARPLLEAGSLHVLRFDGQKPRSDRAKLADILSKLRGLVRICDPYYGLRTLDLLETVAASVPIRFLTVRTSESGPKLANALKDFKRERPKCEFRIASNPASIHDRYIIAGNQVLLVGHGLKDVGSKESFLIVLDATLVPDLVRETTASFDRSWVAGSAF